MKNLTPEMMEKAKMAASAEELLTMAKVNGFELTREEAAAYFSQLHPVSGELSDDDLDNVSGGGCGSGSGAGNLGLGCDKWVCASCGGTVKAEGACSNCHVVASCVRCKHVVLDPDGSYFCNQ